MLLVAGVVSSASAGPVPTVFPDEPVPGTRVSDHSRYISLSTFWTQVDTLPDGTPVPPGTAAFGNVHVGYLDVYEYTGETVIKVPGQRKVVQPNSGTFAYAQIQDFDCPVGVLPPTGGGHGEGVIAEAVLDDPVVAPEKLEQIAEDAAIIAAIDEPPAGGCVHIGLRTGQEDGLTLSVDRKLATATATGNLLMYSGGDPHSGEPGTVVGRPRVDVVWTGVGDTGHSENTGTYRRGTQRWQYESSGKDREATMSGILGPMGFAPELSGGYMNVGDNSSTQRY